MKTIIVPQNITRMRTMQMKVQNTMQHILSNADSSERKQFQDVLVSEVLAEFSDNPLELSNLDASTQSQPDSTVA